MLIRVLSVAAFPPGSKQLRTSGGLSFGNQICGVKFAADTRERALAAFGDNEDCSTPAKPLGAQQAFGMQYSFWLDVSDSPQRVRLWPLMLTLSPILVLQDAIDDCPEYLVHIPTFKKWV